MAILDSSKTILHVATRAQLTISGACSVINRISGARSAIDSIGGVCSIIDNIGGAVPYIDEFGCAVSSDFLDPLLLGSHQNHMPSETKADVVFLKLCLSEYSEIFNK